MKLIEHGTLRSNNTRSRIGFCTDEDEYAVVWNRYLALDGEKLFRIGNVCGTCSFFFHRLTQATSIEIASVTDRLNQGLAQLSAPVLDELQCLLPAGDFDPCLWEVCPHLVDNKTTLDYFTSDLLESWDLGGEDGEIEFAYYRGEDREIAKGDKRFEFFIPLYDIEKLDAARVEHYRAMIRKGARPTAVAVGVLDVKTSVMYPEVNGVEVTPDYPSHWCFANYLLDGHHKLHAAALEGRPITLLSFIARDASWRLVDELIEHYEQGR